MKKTMICVIALFGLSAVAQAVEGPKVSYSGFQTMESAEGSVSGNVNVTPMMERREMGMGGEQTIMIIRRDKKTVWTLMPSQQMYMESKLGDRPDDVNSYTINEMKPMGEEVVNGIPCKKSKVVMTARDGSKMGGFWWMSKEDIPIKMDMIAKDKGGKMRMKQELTKLKIGKQKPSLFEVPAGYSKMSMGMGSMFGGGSNDDGEDNKNSGESEKNKEGGLNIKDALDLFW